MDFTWVHAGPQATRILGMLGAEVIRVEWPDAPDLIRVISDYIPQGVEPSFESSGGFNNFDCNKLSCTLNVRDPRGLTLLKRLLAVSDVVIENFSSRVMEKWGLPFAEMQRANPRIIYVSMAGFGHSGPYRDYDTWGPAVQAASGLTFISGMPGLPPSGWGHSYMDHTAGYYGAMATLAALHHRNRTGKGQYVDVSQVEVGCTLTGPSILDFTVNGRPTRRPGFPPGNRTTWPGLPITSGYSRGAHAAPHNVYRCAGGGHYDWCTIVCRTEEEWEALVKVLGQPAWAREERFATLLGRLEHQEELDRHIGAWTATKEKLEVTTLLQAAGVASAPVQSMSDRVESDPQLKHRGTFTSRADHAVLGEHRFEGLPMKLSETPWELRRGGPLMGQDNAYVFGELLRLSASEQRELDGSGVLWPLNMER